MNNYGYAYDAYYGMAPQYGVTPVPQLRPIGTPSSVGQSSYGPATVNPQAGVQQGMNAAVGLASAVGSSFNPILGAGIGLIGDMASKAVSTGLQNASQRSLMAYQAELNSPLAQMRRMNAAGINPAAAAQGIAGSPGAGSVAGGSAGMAAGVPNLIDTIANSENTALNAEALRLSQDEVRQRVLGLKLDNTIKSIETGTYGEYRRAEISEMRASADEKRQNVEESRQNVRNLQAEYDNIKKNYWLIEAQIGSEQARKVLQQAETALARAKKETESTVQSYNEANTAYVSARTETERLRQDPEWLGKVASEEETAKGKAQAETTPVTKEQQRVLNDFHAEYDALKADYDRTKAELDSVGEDWFGTKSAPLEYHLKTLEGKMKNIEDKYYERLRGLGVNKTESMSMLGVSRSESK